MKTILRWSFATVALAGLMMASPASAAKVAPAPTPAQLVIEDNAELFSADAKERAKSTIASAMGDGNRQVHMETYKKLSTGEQTQYEAANAKEDKADLKVFWKEWAKDKLRNDRGVMILVNRSPGHVHVIADKQMADHGFSSEKTTKIYNLLKDSLVSAKKAKDEDKSEADQMAIRDAGLQSVMDYVKSELPHTTQVSNAPAHVQKKDEDKKETSIGTYICIGVVGLLGLWLIIGLIRSFSGGGGGGGGMGGGGGGGGMFTGLLGGMFGAMAGMWMYNNLFGGNTSSAFGDNGGGGGDTGSSESGGAGDYSGDGGTGGDFDGGSSSGGDYSGGGGDWGGGGGDSGGGDF